MTIYVLIILVFSAIVLCAAIVIIHYVREDRRREALRRSSQAWFRTVMETERSEARAAENKAAPRIAGGWQRAPYIDS